MASFAAWLKQEVDRQGTTVYALAEKAGLKYQTVDGIIRYNRRPRLDIATKIEDALGAEYPGEDAEAPDPEPLMTAEKAEEYQAKDIEVVLAGNPALSDDDRATIMSIIERKERELKEAEKRSKKGKAQK